jgi:UDP-N-acetyl-2-amino-2-deoxyglucuronate dehydrogenase
METTIRSKPKFVIIGGAGNIAKYHFEAIEKVGGGVKAIIDPAEPNQHEPWYDGTEMYDEEADAGYLATPPDYFVILSPNHLHVEHTTWALKYADVICEKPLAISTSELAHLKSEESLGQTRVYPIMQMRKHPLLKGLREMFQKSPPSYIYIKYVLPRNKIYHDSWKGDSKKSGGIIYEIAIHMLDFIVWTFGNWKKVNVNNYGDRYLDVLISFENTLINLIVSTEQAPQRAARQIKFNFTSIDLYTTLPFHLYAYQDIIAGNPLSIPDIEPTIKLCEEIRNYK